MEIVHLGEDEAKNATIASLARDAILGCVVLEYVHREVSSIVDERSRAPHRHGFSGARYSMKYP